MAEFDPDAYLKSAPAFDPDAYLKSVPAPNAEPADHGLSERQKLSPMGKALSPITGYWDTYQRMRGEAYNQAAEGIHQMTHPDSLTDPEAHGLADVGMGALKTAAGGFNYLLGSPINAAYRSIIGQPIEDVTGIPREYTEFGAQLATPGIGFTKLAGAPGAVAETMPRIRTLEGPDLASPTAEANRKLAEEFDIPLTRGQATENPSILREEDMAARGAYGPPMQDIAKPAFEDQFEAIQRAGQRVGQTVSRGEQPLGTPADAAASLNTEIEGRAAAARAERDKALQAAEAQRAQQQAQADQQLARQREQAEQDLARQRQLANDRAQAISQGIAGGHPMIENPRDAGELVGQGIRDAATQNRAEFRSLYDQFGQMEGSLPLDAVRGMGTRLRDDLSRGDHPVVIDDHLTPAASRAIQMLDEMSSRPSIPNRAAPRTPMPPDTEIAGVNLQGIDRMRRHLVAFYKAAPRGSEDQRAVRAIMGSFDGQVEHAITTGLFSGDPRALEVLQQARASYARYRQMFGPTRAGDDVGLAMQRIVDRHATPEEIANMVIGSGKLGNAGLPVRIADRLEQVLGAQSPEFNSVRQAIWQKASEIRNAAGEIDPLKSANAIRDFTGSTLARRMFEPQELAAMRNHADGLRMLDTVADSVPASQKAATAAHVEATKGAKAAFDEATTKAHNAYEAAFGGGEFTGSTRAVFRRMAEGTATPEETANAMFAVIGGGNPGDAVRALTGIERIVGKDSPVMGTIRQGVWQKLIQNPLGKDPQGQQKLVQGINEFLNGKGRTIAKQLYTDQERALMQRYADAVRKTIIGKYARTNSDTAIASAAQAHRNVSHIASMISSFLHLGPIGHIGGNAVANFIGKRLANAATAKRAQALRESVNDVVPPQPPMVQGKLPRTAPSAFRPFAIPQPPQRRSEQP